MTSPYEAVLFDLDDTLVTLADALPKAWGAARSLCVQSTGLNPDDFERVSLEVRVRLFSDLDAGRLRMTDVRRQMFAETLKHFGITDGSLTERLHRCFGETQLAELRTFEDVAILPILQQQVRLAVITNGAADDHPESQRSKLRHFGLDRLLEFSLISDDIGARKPRAEIFQLALDRLQVEGSRTLFVGDSLSTDVAGANGAGLVSVWLNRFGVDPGDLPPRTAPGYIISSLWELPALIGVTV